MYQLMCCFTFFELLFVHSSLPLAIQRRFIEVAYKRFCRDFKKIEYNFDRKNYSHCQIILTFGFWCYIIHVYLRKLWLFRSFFSFRYTGNSNFLIGNRLGSLLVARSPRVREVVGSILEDFKIGSRCFSAKRASYL
jgi:hypothetical protein